MEILSSTSNIALIVIGFGLLIAIHEFGHFIAARWAGIRVESFAVGMGPTVLAYRRGLGVRFGSTAPDIKTRYGAEPEKIPTAELHADGVGETEYSLRLLPIGGFVRMKGQEDMDPTATNHAIDGYGSKPVWKRMIVVSAGVFLNMVTAVILFVVAFMVGVKFEAPMIGAVRADSPAARARGLNGVANGLMPGDQIDSINGEPMTTFADIQIGAAMSHPNDQFILQVTRAGVPTPLQFEIDPIKDTTSGLRSFGVTPARSATLADNQEIAPVIENMLVTSGLAAMGVKPGSTLTAINGVAVMNAQALDLAFAQSNGKPISTTWSLAHISNTPALNPSLGSATTPPDMLVTLSLSAEPKFEQLFATDSKSSGEYDLGLIGFSPLVRIDFIQKTSPNIGILQVGDIVLAIQDRSGPRLGEFRSLIQTYANRSVQLQILRAGQTLSINARVDSQGRLDVMVGPAWNVLISARVIDRVLENPLDLQSTQTVPTPIASLELRSLTKIISINDIPLTDWASMRDALWVTTADAFATNSPATLNISFENMQPNSPVKSAVITVGAAEINTLQKLGWSSPLPSDLFQPQMITRSAGGNPLLAATMGFTETKKLAVLTWLTLDRLARGTVGVEQLRGPVGIVQVGTRVADRGIMYLLFFLAMISVNLAVLNFLPLPIVDGGLFLFLLYEGCFGRPPSVRFQNAASLLGLAFLGSLFVITFYNDVVRLFTGG